MSSTRTFKIASIPGDGIGTEITAAAIQVLNTLSKSSKNAFKFEFEHLDYSSENYSKRGWYMPEDGIEKLKKSDAIFFGAVGWPSTCSPSAPDTALSLENVSSSPENDVSCLTHRSLQPFQTTSHSGASSYPSAKSSTNTSTSAPSVSLKESPPRSPHRAISTG